MNLRQLLYFVNVVERRGFTKAAEALRVSQPALGLQIQKLENEIGTRLLDRLPRGIALTPAGALLVDHARDILNRVQVAKDALENFQALSNGSIVVGMPTNCFLSFELIRQAQTKLPNASISVSEGFMPNLFDMVASNQAELACVYQVPRQDDLDYEPLCDEKLWLIGSSDDLHTEEGPIEFDEAFRRPMILPKRNTGMRRFLEKMAASRQMALSVVVETDSDALTVRLIESNFGCTIRPQSCMPSMSKRNTLAARLIVGSDISMPLGLIRRRNHSPTALGEMTRQLIQTIVKDTYLRNPTGAVH